MTSLSNLLRHALTVNHRQPTARAAKKLRKIPTLLNYSHANNYWTYNMDYDVHRDLRWHGSSTQLLRRLASAKLSKSQTRQIQPKLSIEMKFICRICFFFPLHVQVVLYGTDNSRRPTCFVT